MQTTDTSYIFSYRQGVSKLLSRSGVKDIENPGKAFLWVGQLHFGMSMVLTLLLTGMAIGDWMFGQQAVLNWSESPVILFNCFVFFLLWPMYTAGRIGIIFHTFLQKHCPEALDAKSPEWSAWVRRLTNPRIGVIVLFILLFFITMAGYVSEGQGWWNYIKWPIIGMLVAYQSFHLLEVRKFREYIQEEMELLKRNLQ